MSFRIESERLIIREWSESDFAPFLEIVNDPEVMRYIGPGLVWTQSQMEAFLGRQSESVERHGFCVGALESKADGQLLGHCGIQHLGTGGDVEVGWWLARRHWGQGFGTEAGQAALTFAFDELDLAQVLAIAHSENKASRRVMERLGMQFQRRLKGGELDLPQLDAERVLYRILRKEFSRENASQSGSSAA